MFNLKPGERLEAVVIRLPKGYGAVFVGDDLWQVLNDADEVIGEGMTIYEALHNAVAHLATPMAAVTRPY